MRAMLLPILLATGLLAAAEPATAAPVFSDAEWGQQQTVATQAPSSAAGAMAGVLGSLVAVVAVVAGLGYAVKRLGVRRLVAGKGRHLQVVETVPIALKRQVGLVRVGDQVVLVGIGEHELCHLGTMPAAAIGLDAAPLGSPPEPSAPAPVQPSAFQQVLAGLGRGRR